MKSASRSKLNRFAPPSSRDGDASTPCMATKKIDGRAPSAAGKTPRKARSASKAKNGTGVGTTRKTPQKDPEGGLTAEGRKAFARKEGSHLRPGVKGAADTPEKMRRKGSFLRRHFAHPRGPVERDGKPTRLALSAHAWGEPVPQDAGDVRKLAAKGKNLLERYQRTKTNAAAKTAGHPAKSAAAQGSASSPAHAKSAGRAVKKTAKKRSR